MAQRLASLAAGRRRGGQRRFAESAAYRVVTAAERREPVSVLLLAKRLGHLHRQRAIVGMAPVWQTCLAR